MFLNIVDRFISTRFHGSLYESMSSFSDRTGNARSMVF